MKPHRVKRVDPQSRPGEFSLAACGPPGAGDPLTGPRPGGARGWPGALSPPSSATTDSAAVTSPAARWLDSSEPSVIGRRGGHVVGSRTLAASAGLGPFWGSQLRTHCFAGRRNRTPDTGPYAVDASGQWRIGRSSTRPVLKHGPRSLTCARVMGSIRNPKAQ